MNKIKRSLAMLLILCMLISAVPVAVFAEETDSTNPAVTEPVETTTATEAPEETTVATEETAESTEETTVTTEETTEPTEEITEVTEETIEATEAATEATEEATDPTEETVEGGIAMFGLARGITLGDKPEDGTVTGEPFDTTVSKNYRIPGLVNHNGTLIAVADARWDYEYDGGGSDIVVSRSGDGETWSYTFSSYLGDNGNVHAKNSSTLMDPLVVTDGSNLYLFYDLFPAGYSLGGGSNTTYAFSATGDGFDDNGRLLLVDTYNSTSYGYYLENGKIYSTAGEVQTDYTVDAWFNVYENGTYVSNLFFAEAPFYAYPTSYIAMQTSEDGGANWSDPELVPVKHAGTKWQVLGPGSGLITCDGEIAFTVYNSDSSISLVYGTSGNWKTVKTSAATNESSIVELSDGTIRAFVKNSSNVITYVDFAKTDSGYTAGEAKSTNVSNTGWCMISSMMYSKQIGGEDVIFVCCPNSSGLRRYGTVYAFKSSDMSLLTSYQIDTGYSDQFFAYSDMVELDNGTIAMLYEDGCLTYASSPWNGSAAGVGYSHIKYIEIDPVNDMGLTFDAEPTEPEETEPEETEPEETEPVETEPEETEPVETEPVVTVTDEGLSVESAEEVTEISGLTAEFVAYEVTLSKDGEEYHDAATVTIPLNGKFAGVELWGFVVNDDGTITYVKENVERDLEADTVTFTAPHFSTVGATPVLTDAGDTQSVTVDVGANETITLSGTYIADQTIDNEYVTVVVDGTEGREATTTYVEAENVYCSDLINTDADSWTGTRYYYKYGESYYPLYAKRTSENYYGIYTSYTYTWGYLAGGTYEEIDKQETNSWNDSVINISVYTQSGAAAVDPSTTITFTGVKVGTTSVEVGGTTYNVTVHGDISIKVNYVLSNGTEVSEGTLTVRSDAASTTLGETVTGGDNTYKVSNTTLTLDGSSEYNVTVYGQKDITVNYRVDGTTVATRTLTVWENDTTATLPNSITAADGTQYTVSNPTLGLTSGLDSYDVTVTKYVGPTVGDISDFNNIVGEDTYEDENTNATYKSVLDMEGKVIQKLTISAGASFNLNVDVTDYDSIEWSVANDSVATVDEDGVVTAVAVGETTVTATVVKNDKIESITIPVVVKPSQVEGVNNKVPVFFYIEQVENTTPYYTMFLSTGDDDVLEAHYTLVPVTAGEVIWIERPTASALGWIWTATPDANHALVYMASTGSSSQYYPLKNTSGELGESDYNATSAQNPGDYYKYSISYKNVVSVGTDVGETNWGTALDQHLATSINATYNCDGAMSNTRWGSGGTHGVDKVPTLISSVTFISDPVPTIDKTVDGVLPATRLRADYRRYTEGMVASVGELVYFKITITVDRPTVWVKDSEGNDTSTGAITYSDAIVSDTVLKGAYLYTKDLDQIDGTYDGEIAEENRAQTTDITDQLNAEWGADEQTRTIDLYLVYQIQEGDIPKFVIDNVADLHTNYQSTYSAGASARKANAKASITVVGRAMDNIVIDFGQKVTVTGLTDTYLKGVYTGEKVKYSAKYGTVEINQNADGTYDVTYTPTSILQGADAVWLYGLGLNADNEEVEKIINGFIVYPATTVYYEEGFIFGNRTTGSWNLENAKKATLVQAYEPLGKSVFDSDGKLTDKACGKEYEYGYDPIYNSSSTGSAGSYAVSTMVGDQTVFTFTGTGFELYANSESASGYVTVYSQGNLSKMYMINTKLTDVDGNEMDGTYYGLPIISETELPYGTYTVYIKHTNAADPIYIDGVRIINTIYDQTQGQDNIYYIDQEDNPVFHEIRDYVLNAIGVENLEESDYISEDNRAGMVSAVTNMAGQVYTALGTGTKAVVIDNGTTFTEKQAQDLLDNGPKNELYLYPGQTLVFSVTTNRVMQLGLKAPTGSAEFTLVVDGTTHTLNSLSSTVDMFYKIAEKGGTAHTVSITVSKGVLSVTDLKICDDPNATFTALTQQDIENTLLAMYGLDDEVEIPTEPETEPTEPETEPTEPETEPTEPETEPTEPETEPTEPETEPTEPETEATEPETEPTEPETEPTEPETEPTEPESKPTKPTKPGKPGHGKPGSNRPTRPGQDEEPEKAEAVLNIVFINLRGKQVGSATLTEIGNENDRCVFSASDISAQAPAKYRVLWFFPAIVSYGDTVRMIVTVI